MARISKYTKDSTVEKTDKLIGSNLNGDTANFTIDDIAKFLRETNLAGNPDQVTYYYDGNQSTGYLDSPSVTNFESSSTRTIRFSIYSYGNTSDTRADFLDTFSGRFTLLINVDDPNNFMMAKVTNIATSGDYKTFTFAAPEHGKGSFVAGKVYSFLLHQGDAGDITDVTSATTNQLTVANGAGPAPALTIVTGAIANGGTGLATADQIHTFVTGQTDAIAASTTGNAATATKIASITNSDIVQLTSSQTLTNKILTSPVINTGISGTAIKDEDDMSSNSATHLATQQSIKAYVDTQIATEDTIAELNDTTIGTLANGHLLLYDNDSSVWENKALSGDATITKDGALTLGTVYSGSSSVGSSTAIPVLTIDGKGRITGTSTASISSTLTVGADSGSNDTVTIGTDTLDFSGGTGIDTTVSDNDISIAIDSTVTTLTGSQTLTNKTLTSPILNTGVSGTAIKDEDDMASDSATHLATQQSIKAYVDASTTSMITVSANNSTDETVYPVFVDGATGSQGAETDTGLTYNPSSGLLTSTSFSGNLTGNVTGNVSGTAATVTGAAQSNITSLGTLTTLTVDNVIINGSTIGHTGDTDLITVASGVLTVAGEIDATSLDISGDADIDGTTNLDAVDIDGAVQLDGTFTVGVDDTGYDVKFFGATSGKYLLWDESDNNLEFTDDVKASFGDGGDLKIWHDSGTATSYISDQGSGDLYIQADNMIRLESYTGTEKMARFNYNGAVELFYDNSKKFETTSAGATVTGTLTADAFSGPLTGNVTGTASLVTVSDSTANTNFPVVFHDESNALLDDTGALRYNPSTGTLLVPNLNVAGTTTQVDTVTMEAANAVVFEGATSDAYETTLSIVDPTADHTQYLINQGGYIPVLAAATTTAITATPAELNLLDTAVANTVVNSKAVIYGSSGELAGTLSTAAQGNVTSLGTLTTLTVDNVIINGTTIGHTSDTDLLTLASGGLTVLGTVTVGVDDTGHDVKFFGATSGSFMLWDESDDSLELTDSTYIKLGDSGDFKMWHDGSNTYLSNEGVGHVYIQNTADDKDIIFKSDDGSGGTAEYYRLDGGDNINYFSKHIKVPDSVKMYVGSSQDLELYHDATDSIINNNTGHLYITNYADNKDIYFRSDDGSGGVATYFYVSGSAEQTVFVKNTNHPDGTSAYFGNSNDLRIVHTSDTSYITNNVGNLEIIQNTDDGDIIFKSDDGSGGTAEYFRVDGGLTQNVVSKNMKFLDSVQAMFGTGIDLRIYHDATDSKIESGTGDLYITQNADDKDIIFQCDDGSGGIEEYFRLDGSANGVHPQTSFPDNSNLTFGGGPDTYLYHNGTDFYLSEYTGHLKITNYANDKDIIFSSDDGSGGTAAYITLDGSAVLTQFDKHTKHVDSIRADFGNSSDLQLYHDGSHSYITNDTGALNIIQNTNDGNIVFTSDDGAGGTFDYFSVDGGSTTHNGSTTTAAYTKWPDNSRIALGTGKDLQLWHDGTTSTIYNSTGNLHITCATDDSDIRFYGHDGSSGVTEYFRVDGGADRNIFSRSSRHSDNVVAAFGTDEDLQIYHDGSNSYIAEGGTGGLVFKSNHYYFQDTSGNTAFNVSAPAGDATFAGDVKLSTASKKIIADFSSGGTTRKTELELYNSSDGGFILNNEHSSTGGIKFQIDGSDALSIAKSGKHATFAGNILASADSSHDIGTTSVRFANVYADTLYGDGSNITGVTAEWDGSHSGDATITGALTLVEASDHALIINRAANNHASGILIHNDNDAYGGSIEFKTEYSGTDTNLSRIYCGTDGSNGHMYLQVADSSDSFAYDTVLRLSYDNSAHFTGHVNLAATKKLFLDGGSHTFLQEISDDRLGIYAGSRLMLDLGEDGDASSYIDMHAPTVSIHSNQAEDPMLQLKNTTNDANGSKLRFTKDRGAAGQDDDLLGTIDWLGKNDAGSPENIEYARIQAQIKDASDGAEGGKLRLGVASHDGDIGYGLVLTDGDADGEVDATIGASATSLTTVAGDLSIYNKLTFRHNDNHYIQSGTDNWAFKANSGTSALLLTTGGNATFAGNVTASSGTGHFSLVNSSAYQLNGTYVMDSSRNLVNIGTITAAGTVTVGVDDTGYDVKFFGATAGKYMLWDESADRLEIVGEISISGDGSNDVVISESGSGHLTIDAPGNINLDADGGDINLKDGTTFWGQLTQDSSHFIMEAKIADKDIILRGTDNTTQIDALRLDMSEGGDATFAGNIAGSGHVTLSGDGKAFRLYPSSYDNWAITTDSNGLVIYNETDSRYDLKISGTGTATFAGLISAGAGINVTGNIDTPELSINDYVKHNGDTNTYFGFSGADTYTVVTGGTTAFTIDSSQIPTFRNGTASGTAMYIHNFTDAVANTKTLIDFRVQGSDNSPFYVAGQMGSKAEGTWTSTSSTRDASLIFNTVLNGNNELALTLASDKTATFQGQINAVGGNATTPSYIFEGDTNTGFFHPAADTIAFSTAGSERMRIISDGKVGIGKTPSTWAFDVDTGLVYIASFDGANNTGVVINSNNATAAQIMGYSNSASTYNDLDIRANATAGSGVYIDGSASRVGIGTTSPIVPLHIVGTAVNNPSNGTGGYEVMQVFDDTAYATGVGGGIGLGGKFHSNGTDTIFGEIRGIKENATDTNYASALTFSTRANSASITERMRIDSSGRVGIGITPANGFNSARLNLGTGAVSSEVIAFATASGGNAELRNTSNTGTFSITNNDGSTNLLTIAADGDTAFVGSVTIDSDTAKLYLGADDDLHVYHTGTDGYVLNKTGDLYLMSQAHGGDIIFKTENSSGTAVTPLTLDSAGAATFAGDVTISGHENTINIGAGGGVGTFTTSDANDYPRITTPGASAQLGLFRSGSAVGGVYIGADSAGFDIRNESFTVLFQVDMSGNVQLDGLIDSDGTGTNTFAGTVDAVNYKVNGGQGSDGQVLTSTGSGVAWEGNWTPFTGGTIGATTITSTTSPLLILNPTANNYGGIQFNYGGATKGISMYNSGFMVFGGEASIDTRIQAGGQYAMHIDEANRNVHIGSTTDATYKLAVNGTFYAAGNATFAGDVDVDGHITLTGSSKNIVLDYTNEIRTKDSGGTERTVLRASSNKLQYGWSYAGEVEFMGGGSYTPRITINTDGHTSFSTHTKAYSTIGGSDNVRTGIAHYDNTAQAANIGGQLVLGYKYTDAGDYTEGAIIKMYKENGTTGQYGSGLNFQVRSHGEDLSTKMILKPNGQLRTDGDIVTESQSGLYIKSNTSTYHRIYHSSSTNDLVIDSANDDVDVACWLRVRNGDGGTIGFEVDSTSGHTGIGGQRNTSYELYVHGATYMNGSLAVNGDTNITGNVTAKTLTSHNNRGQNHGGGADQEFPIGHWNEGEEVFSIDPTWTNDQLQNYFGSSNVEWLEDSTAPAGWAIKITNGVNVGGAYDSGFPYIAIDEDAIYYMECHIRGLDSDTSVNHYMGSIDYKEDFTNPSSGAGNPGSYGYWVMSNATTAGQTWTKATGIIRGFHNTTTGMFETGAKYWTPQALFNYSHGAGTRACVISGWKVVKISKQRMLADGAAATPSLTFAEDQDTGMFRNSANSLSLATGGTQALSIDSSQNATVAGTLTVNNSSQISMTTSTGEYLQFNQNSETMRLLGLGSTWCHILTTSDRFYFDKPLWVDTGNIGSYNEDVQHHRAGTNYARGFANGIFQPHYLGGYDGVEGGSTGRRIIIKGSGDNNITYGPYDDNGWAYFESVNNSSGLYFNVNQGNFAFDTGDIIPYTDNEISCGGSSNRFTYMYCSQEVRSSGDVVAYYSDERLKNIHGTIPNALEKTLALTGFYYTQNETAKELGYENDKQQVGVSAQEVQKVLPEAVGLAPVDMHYDKETKTTTSKSGKDYLTVKYEKIVPLLIESIKELKAEIDELKKCGKCENCDCK